MKLNQLMLEADILDLAAFSPGTTYHQVCDAYQATAVQKMQIDRTLQKLRRSGKIKWERRGPSIVWVRV